MKGTPKAVEFLAKAISGEITAVHQYTRDAEWCKNNGIEKLGERFSKEAAEEMGHMKRFLERLTFLETETVMTAGPVLPYVGPEAIIENQFSMETGAVSLYREAYAGCLSEGDVVTANIFLMTLTDEEDHLNYLEEQKFLIKNMGLALYIAHQT